MTKLIFDLAYLGGVAGTVLAVRWLMHLTTPEQDWRLLERGWCAARRVGNRLLSRWRVALLDQLGYTHIRWLALRRKWRAAAAYE